MSKIVLLNGGPAITRIIGRKQGGKYKKLDTIADIFFSVDIERKKNYSAFYNRERVAASHGSRSFMTLPVPEIFPEIKINHILQEK
jgi:hypothetical protein